MGMGTTGRTASLGAAVDADGDMDNTLCVPLSSLAQPDDREALQTPAAGDTVSLQVDATVDRIEGDQAYLTLTAVNGKPLEAEARPELPEAAEQREGEELRGLAAEM